MRGYFIIFAMFLVFLATVSAAGPISDPEGELFTGEIHDRSRRSDCDFNACDRWCHRMGLPGGACVHDKCDCDRF